MKKCRNYQGFFGKTALLLLTGMSLPLLGQAQDVTTSLQGMQPVLDNLYSQMLELCGSMIGVAQGIAGFGALWFIASRVWRHIARAEPIDFYPLLRPFVLGLAIISFQILVIPVMNGILQPIVTVTAGMVTNSNQSIAVLLKQKEEAVKKSSAYQMYVGDDGNGDRDKWYQYTHPDDPNGDEEGVFSGLGNDVKFWMDKQSYNFKNNIKQWMSEILQVLYAAAILCINTIRTFYLIVLAILGPLVFGFAVFDGLQHTLTQWISRYINIFLWLPIANIFGSIIGKVQEKMIALDISQIQDAGDTFFSPTDTAYLIFLCIGIVGYFSVPSVANYVIHAHGGNGLLSKVTQVTNSTVTIASQTAASAAGRAGQGAGNLISAPGHFASGLAGESEGRGSYGAAGRAAGKTGAYLHDKLSGD